MEEATGYANTESAKQSRWVKQNLGVFRVGVVYKVTALDEVTKGVSVDRKEKVHTSEVRVGFMNETGVQLGMLGY